VKTLQAADLFAGAGGMSTGLMSACRDAGVLLNLVAVNHWPTAVQTHTVNHPAARHFCAPVESVDPRVAVPGGRLDILMAAPECVHFSTARGGRPMNDQSRASAWHLLRWLELLRVEDVLIENVPEFLTWGPLGATGRPLKAQRGSTFRAFVAAVESLNYRVEWRILNAADYGEATTRRRLFIRARRGRKAIDWPEPTHGKRAGGSLLRHVRPWRAAREVIDWTITGESIFARKRPLAPATMRRIVEGLRRFGGPQVQPFIVAMEHGGRTVSVDDPLPTITTAKGGAFGVAEPFLVPFYGEREGQEPRTHDVAAPLPVIPASAAKFGLVEPFVVQLTHGGRLGSVDAPFPTIPAGHRGEFGVVEPFIFANRTNNVPKSIDEPIPPLCTADHIALVEPFVVQFRGTSDDQIEDSARSVEDPLGTLTAGGTHHAVVQPFLLGQHGGATARPVDEPAPTIATDGAISLIEPYLTQYYGSGSGLIARSVQAPLPPVTTKERFALVEPIVIDGKTLDIRFRMLKPHELSAAMGFPKDYQFTGTKTEHVKQIGNAVSVQTARALCFAAIDNTKADKARKAQIA
jgi:DNA (cytosine-5)-methyltransferase 1